MAKKSMKEREEKRKRLVARLASKRAELKKAMFDASLSDEAREQARVRFHSMPRDASATRVHNRCGLTGRTHGYYRKFGLGRNKLREAAMRGDIPGLVKASW
ncbi:MAG: 30S ribosomal protein S14 [Gammaproteobacteria bacterium]|nr:30S ribosomal protein S14 [Gammaproteobacteria bacterium]